MASYEMVDGVKILRNRTKIAGRDNIADLPEKIADQSKKPAKAHKPKAKTKEVT